jgi:aryl-alcohol dehydrogenase-like predicted oxidoreductase
MATPESTENYFKRLAHRNIPEDAIQILGGTGFKVSSIGFGGYRIHYNSIEHARALRYALLNGINLIDTSSNYTDGGSEMLIGNLLQEMFERGELHPDEVVVVSKVGYVQGQNMSLAQEYEAQGQPFPDMVKYLDGCWHCIHPEFLEDQLSRSLERLYLPALDVYLLHNPEYFLSDIKKHGGLDLESARNEYYRRIKLAFQWMEEKVAEGKIKAYGISSNTFPNEVSDLEFTSLEKVIEIAESISSNSYFRVIQFPFNPYETGACFEKNQSNGSETLLQLAAEKNLATLVNRPLNAMANGSMLRLASFRETDEGDISNDFSKYCQDLSELEQRFKDEILPNAPPEIPKDNLLNVFSISQQLSGALEDFQNWEHWDHVKQNVVLPQCFSYLSYLSHKLDEDKIWPHWSEAYANTLWQFLDTISKKYENQAQKRSKQISDKLDGLNKALHSSETLSQKTLQLLTSVTGIDCVLLGMRRMPYVEDAVAALKQPKVPKAEDVLRKFIRK